MTSKDRKRWPWIALTCTAVIVVVWLILRDRWDDRGIGEVIALSGGHAVTVESTYSRTDWERELTLTRVDDRGEPIWRTRLMSGGGNIGDLRSEAPNPSTLLLRLHSKDGIELVALAADDGMVRWRDRGADRDYVMANAVDEGPDLWIKDGSRLELRDAANGTLRWRTDDVGDVLLVGGGAFSRDLHFGKDGARRLIEHVRWNSSGRPCVVGYFVLGMYPVYQGLSAPRLENITVHAAQADGEPERWEIPIDARWRDAITIELGSTLCGRAATTDVIAIEYGREGRQRDLVGLEHTNHHPRWTLPFGSDRAVWPFKDIWRGRDFGKLPRYVALVIQVDNRIQLEWTVREGESGVDAGARAAHEFREKGGLRHDYRLDLVDVELGRLVWTLPLADATERAPSVLRTNCCQVIIATDLSRIFVISSESGEIVKAVHFSGTRYVLDRQIADDVLWLIAPDHRAAHGYRLPEFQSADPTAHKFADATEWARELIVRK